MMCAVEGPNKLLCDLDIDHEGWHSNTDSVRSRVRTWSRDFKQNTNRTTYRTNF